MNDRPPGADVKTVAPGGRIARVVIERAGLEVRLTALDASTPPDPGDFPLVVEVNPATGTLEARRLHYMPTMLAAARGGDLPASAAALHAVLTDREIEVLSELAKGASNKAIARSLGISTGTVRVHVKSVLRKLALDNRTQAAVWLTAANLKQKG